MKFILFFLCLTVPFFLYYYLNSRSHLDVRPHIQVVNEIVGLFPKNKDEVDRLVNKTINQAESHLEKIYALKADQRTFANTFRSLDVMLERFGVNNAILSTLSLVSPDEQVRNASHAGLVALGAFSVDNFELNPRLYKACLEYETRSHKEQLSPVEDYFLKKTMQDFRRGGLELADAEQKRLKEIQKLLSEHALNYEKNIAADGRFVEASKDELQGLDEDFVGALSKTENGSYRLGTDDPTFVKVLTECHVGPTRKSICKKYMQRGYPANEAELTEVIRLRDELAKLLGYPSYAHYDIDNQMAKTPEQVDAFLTTITDRVEAKALKEVALLKTDLPDGVSLTEDGLFYPWDFTYVHDHYKKKHLAIDELLVSEYFPVEDTLASLLSVYENFFGLRFNKVSVKGLWHDSVIFLAVYKDGRYRGSILLDLFPRPFKYTHAGQLTIVPAVETTRSFHPAVLLVVANFPPAQGDKPALLMRKDVITFFHEFGHALHALLGSTELASFSGTSVKGDFVEMPSQMLEEWMWNTDILKKVSKHYKTKEPLPDELINRIEAAKNFSSGEATIRQISLARAALNYFLQKSDKSVAQLWEESQKCTKHIYFDPDNRRYCSFTHLMGYGPKYYGYLWSKVYALDLFDHIKPHGLLNKAMGDRYTSQVIGKGGSKDPAELLKDFLGREPRSDAFFKDLGI